MDKGTLVRVAPDGLNLADQYVVNNHGYLWLYETARPSAEHTRLRHYRSLATGFKHCWYDSEVEVADAEGHTG